MNINFKTLFLTIILLVLSSTISQAQKRDNKYYTKHTAEEFLSENYLKLTINPDSFDYNLFHAILFHLCNQERTKYSKPILTHFWDLEQSAKLHSEEMSQKHFFSHTNKSVKKYRTPANRMFLFNENYKTVGENIVSNNLIDFEGTTLEYQIKDINGETLYFDLNNKELAYTNYLELGKRLTKQWMESPPHKENILSTDFTLLGCACAIEDTGNFISINCTQNFGNLFE
jgi:uncharacterized protein YkwD